MTLTDLRLSARTSDGPVDLSEAVHAVWNGADPASYSLEVVHGDASDLTESSALHMEGTHDGEKSCSTDCGGA